MDTAGTSTACPSEGDVSYRVSKNKPEGGRGPTVAVLCTEISAHMVLLNLTPTVLDHH